jgi:hypothetical protein
MHSTTTWANRYRRCPIVGMNSSVEPPFRPTLMPNSVTIPFPGQRDSGASYAGCSPVPRLCWPTWTGIRSGAGSGQLCSRTSVPPSA